MEHARRRAADVSTCRERLQPAQPTLGFGPRLNAYLAKLLGSSPQVTAVAKLIGGSRRRRSKPTRPTIVELVELLLESALRAQQKNRLLTYFNAALPTATLSPAVRRPLRRRLSGRRRRDEHPVRRGDDQRDRQRHPDTAAAADHLQRPDRDRTATARRSSASSRCRVRVRASSCCRCRSTDAPSRSSGSRSTSPRSTSRRSSPASGSATCPRASVGTRTSCCGCPQIDPDTFEILFERVIGKAPPATWQARRHRMGQAPPAHGLRASPPDAARRPARRSPTSARRSSDRLAVGRSRHRARPRATSTASARRANGPRT